MKMRARGARETLGVNGDGVATVRERERERERAEQSEWERCWASVGWRGSHEGTDDLTGGVNNGVRSPDGSRSLLWSASTRA